MKTKLFVLSVILFIVSCEPIPEPTPEPKTISQLIIGEWEYKIYETGNEWYYFTFRAGTYSVKYFDGERTLASDSPGYSLNDETGEINLFQAMIRDYDKGRIIYVNWSECFIEMTNDQTMTWVDKVGNVYIFNRLNYNL